MSQLSLRFHVHMCHHLFKKGDDASNRPWAVKAGMIYEINLINFMCHEVGVKQCGEDPGPNFT